MTEEEDVAIKVIVELQAKPGRTYTPLSDLLAAPFRATVISPFP